MEQERDQFNLMLASGSFPDIIGNGDISNYTGGAQKAYDDGIIIKLNDLQKKYAPDLMKLYSTYEDVNDLTKNDNGDYLGVPAIKGAPGNIITAGPIIRKDWLDKLGISMPQTMDDWENMLKQFKTKLGASAPLMISYGTNGGYNDTGLKNTFLVGTYGIGLNYFSDAGKIKYGSTDSRFRDFLTEMAKWYKEGLIDPEIGSNSSQTVDAKVSNNKTGAFFGFAGGQIGKYENMMASIDPNFKLTGAPYPVLKKGDTNLLYCSGTIVANPTVCVICSKSQHQDVAMAYLNYGYSKEGHTLYNFGVSGTSFEFENGYPKYTSLITKNPEGISMQSVLMAYGYSSTQGPMIQDPRYSEQYLSSPDQQEALKTWAANESKVTPNNNWMPLGRLDSTESSSVASSETQISTYRDEMLLKFITGIQPINDSSWNTYVKQLNGLGLDNDIKVRQTAEDRFRKNNPDYFKMKSMSSPYELFKNLQ